MGSQNLYNIYNSYNVEWLKKAMADLDLPSSSGMNKAEIVNVLINNYENWINNIKRKMNNFLNIPICGYCFPYSHLIRHCFPTSFPKMCKQLVSCDRNECLFP